MRCTEISPGFECQGQRSKVKVTEDKKTKKCGILFGSRPLGRGPRAKFFPGAVIGALLRRCENQRMLSSCIMFIIYVLREQTRQYTIQHIPPPRHIKGGTVSLPASSMHVSLDIPALCLKLKRYSRFHFFTFHHISRQSTTGLSTALNLTATLNPNPNLPNLINFFSGL